MGIMKYVQTYSPIHSDHVNEASVFLKRGFFLFDIRDDEKKKIRDLIDLRTSAAVFYIGKRRNPWE